MRLGASVNALSNRMVNFDARCIFFPGSRIFPLFWGILRVWWPLFQAPCQHPVNALSRPCQNHVKTMSRPCQNH